MNAIRVRATYVLTAKLPPGSYAARNRLPITGVTGTAQLTPIDDDTDRERRRGQARSNRYPQANMKSPRRAHKRVSSALNCVRRSRHCRPNNAMRFCSNTKVDSCSRKSPR